MAIKCEKAARWEEEEEKKESQEGKKFIALQNYWHPWWRWAKKLRKLGANLYQGHQ